MRRLGEARIEAISLAVVAAVREAGGLELRDAGRALATVAQCIRETLGGDDALDAEVRRRIASLARPVPEGGREWDLLYRQYSEELSRRR